MNDIMWSDFSRMYFVCISQFTRNSDVEIEYRDMITFGQGGRLEGCI